LDEHAQNFVILTEEETEVRSFLGVEGPLPRAVVVGVGGLRLRECFAARNTHSVQDDRGLEVGIDLSNTVIPNRSRKEESAVAWG
jgi:hypothetical protein